MKVNRSELLEILNAVKPGLSSKEIVQEMGNFIFTGEDVVAFNDRICIQHRCEMPGKFSVDAEVFYKAVNKIGGKEIDIACEEGRVTLTRGKSVVSVAVESESELMGVINELNEEVDKGEDDWKKLPEDFREAIRFVRFSTGTDESSVLSCVHVRGDVVESADGTRGTIRRMKGEVEDDLLLRGGVVKELVRVEGLVEYLVAEDWVHFCDEDENLFSVRKIIGDFPTSVLIDIMKPSPHSTAFTFPPDTLKHLDFVDVMTDKDVHEKMVEIELTKNTMTVTATRDIGFAKREIEIEDGPKKKVEFCINPALLTEIIEQAPTVTIDNEGAKLVFETDNFSHILMMRVRGQEE